MIITLRKQGGEEQHQHQSRWIFQRSILRVRQRGEQRHVTQRGQQRPTPHAEVVIFPLCQNFCKTLIGPTPEGGAHVLHVEDQSAKVHLPKQANVPVQQQVLP